MAVVKPFASQAARVSRIPWEGRIEEFSQEVGLAMAGAARLAGNLSPSTEIDDISFRLLRGVWPGPKGIDDMAVEISQVFGNTQVKVSGVVQYPLRRFAQRVVRDSWVGKELELSLEIGRALSQAEAE